MKKLITTAFFLFISIQIIAQINVYRPYRTNGTVMVGDSALFIGKLKIPSFTSYSLGGYADNAGQGFGLNLTNNRLNVRGATSNTLEYYSTTEVNGLITAAGTAQTLSLGSASGNIAISGGNNVSLLTLNSAATTVYASSSTLPATNGFHPFNTTTGATGYPFVIGAGWKMARSGGSSSGLFQMVTSTTADSLLYIQKGTGPFMAIASRNYVSTQDALKANIASPTLTGTPLAPTPASNVNTTQIVTGEWANTYYVPKTLTISINGTTFSLASNRSWIVGRDPIINTTINSPQTSATLNVLYPTASVGQMVVSTVLNMCYFKFNTSGGGTWMAWSNTTI